MIRSMTREGRGRPSLTEEPGPNRDEADAAKMWASPKRARPYATLSAPQSRSRYPNVPVSRISRPASRSAAIAMRYSEVAVLIRRTPTACSSATE
jgi:hypothetical protein